jgi:hypothetical protein
MQKRARSSPLPRSRAGEVRSRESSEAEVNETLTLEMTEGF